MSPSPRSFRRNNWKKCGRKCRRRLKKDAVVHQYVDESIIGGLVLRVQDKLIDASVKTQIELREQLLREQNC